ncbi:polysaccharide pyruvyl transferase family protein [Actinoplanes sp. NPDC051346]|uniref:polysaccharide pyruvyl transferase family protein n=1 Tax=Actinoplanes sp. NPDC051346 TaxID=3155048 RepID=UPI0034490AE6
MRGNPLIVCFNHWHDDNKGDSAITGGILRLLRDRWPAARIRVTSLHEAGTAESRTQFRHLSQNDDIDTDCTWIATEIGSAGGRRVGTVPAAARWLLRLLPKVANVAIGRVDRETRHRLSGVDLVVLVGGSNIYDNPSVTPLLSWARLFCILFPAWAATRLDIPVVLAGHTLGPFPRATGRWIARRLLSGAGDVTLREQTSVQLSEQLGLRAADVAPDMAFATPAQRTRRVQDALGSLPGPHVIALAPRTHPHAGAAADDRVIDELVTLARDAYADGKADGFVVVAQCQGPTPVEDDRPIAERLAARLERSVPVVLMEEDLSPQELAALYGSCSLVIAVRLHAAILALAQGTPAYAIAYLTRKTEGVMAGAGLPDAWCEYGSFSAKSAAPVVERLLHPDTRHDLTRRSHRWQGDLTEISQRWSSRPSRPSATVDA